MTAIRCLIIADDLTGAGDTGVQFAAKGMRTLLAASGRPRRLPPDGTRWPVLAVNTNSRALEPRRAYRRVSDLLVQLDVRRFEIIYKKIDSTLRGNIGSETDALLDAADRRVGFLAAAFPVMGRTVEEGILKVGGVPVAETEASRDPVCPVTESHVPTLLQRQTARRVGFVGQQMLRASPAVLREAVAAKIDAGENLLVFDCLERRDLAAIAALGTALQPMPLFIGSAGLAEALATLVSPRRSGRIAQRPAVTPAAHVVVVCGSASEVSRRQLARLHQSLGSAGIEIRPAFACGPSKRIAPARRTVIRTAAEALSGGPLVLSVSRECIRGGGEEVRSAAAAVAEALGKITARALSLSGVDPANAAFVLTGGDTAMAVLQALGVEGVEISGEPMEGIMAGRARGGIGGGAQVITKAGAFGGDDALLRLVRLLRA
jgi:D-threonate/D-erythronate kinase